MAKISLRNYNRLIENLIDNGKHDEAIAHCRYILQTFSKYIEAYRLLGKAFLEAKRYDDAVDIFQRVLNCVPDDFVSNVGLSIIADDQGRLDEAIWHMERAFEVQPSNAAIQGELQRLFGRRDGVEPPKIRLTRGALAHMYVQGELYAQAVSEIRAVLVNDPERMDMQMLLARAYFRMGQKTEATESCTQLLKRYPYCLDANRILVEILPGTQRADSAKVYRLRVNELDPYAAFVHDSIFHIDQVADSEVSLEQLELQSQSAPAADTGTDWKSDLGIGLAATSEVASSSPSELDWLKQALSAPPPPPAKEPAPAYPEQNQIPDFLRRAGWGQSNGQFQEAASSVADETEAAPALQADLPDWIKALAPADEQVPPATPPSTPVKPLMDIPDWMPGLEQEHPVAASSPQPPVAAANPPATPPSTPVTPIMDIPDWMRALEQEQPAAASIPQPPVVAASPPAPSASQVSPIPAPPPAPQSAPVQPPLAVAQPSVPASNDSLGSLGTSVQEQDDAMAWLESLAAKHGAKAEELVTDPKARTDVAPDWVDKAKAISEPAPSAPAPAAPAPSMEQIPVESDDLTGVWLRNLESSEADQLAPEQDQNEAPDESKPLDWLSGLSSDQDVFSQISNEPAEPVKPKEPLIISSIDLPAWLASLDREESLAAPAAPSAVPASDELPAWLAGGGEAESAAAEPTQPDEWHPADIEPQAVPSTPPDEWHPADIEPQAAPSTPPEDSSVPIEPPAPVKAHTREISIEIEQPQSAKRPAPKPQKQPVVKQPAEKQPARKPESGGLLEVAQSEMTHGNIGAAIDIYVKLIRKGKALEEIIRDLRDALYRYPVEVPLWQALGDTYMRANRLQEALDAYTKAEELLR
jgi:tetratricopeptide (TPR) repeat protein